MSEEPDFVTLRNMMRDTTTLIEEAASVEELRAALLPAFRMLADRYEGRAYDHGEIKRGA